jgi:hypothetical protein
MRERLGWVNRSATYQTTLILTFSQREKELPSKERRFETAVLLIGDLEIAAPWEELPLPEGEGQGEGLRF